MANSGTTQVFYDDSNTYIYVNDVSSDCSALITASVTLDMYPSDPACPPTRATVELWYEKPDTTRDTLASHAIVAPPYTLQSCDDTDYPMRMNVALVARLMLSDWAEYDVDHYSFWLKIIYESGGVDGVYQPYGEADIIIGLFPCSGYQPI